MRKSQLLATTLGAALLAAAPAALAQQGGSTTYRSGSGPGAGYGYTPPPGTPVTPHGQGGAGLVPPVEQQYGAARRAGPAADRDVDSLLRQADAALSRGRYGMANEYLERAETATLNREALGGGTDATAPRSALQRQIDQARQALMNRDRAAAREHVRQAMAMADSDTGGMATDSSSGAATRMAPSQGGGGAAVVPGSSGLGRGNPAAGTQYNPTAVPPYGGPSGTQTMPSQHMPGTSGTQASGVPSVPPTGRGAPPAGQVFPQSGGTSSQLSTGGQIQPGTVTPGGDSGGAGGGGGAGGSSGGGGR